MSKIIRYGKRKGIKDVWWNAYMFKGAKYCQHSDSPYCPTTAKQIPKSIITYAEAITIYNRKMRTKESDFFIDAFICFYLDDYKFDGKNGIWFNPKRALKIIKHFAGIITPDFSTNIDFPDPLLRWNTCRSRAFGWWCSRHGIAVINNVRWGFEESFQYCCDGIPKNDIICIGSVAGGLKRLKNRELFCRYFYKMIDILSPKIVLVYGSAKYDFIEMLSLMNIQVISYPSRRNRKKTDEKEIVL